jgi:NAD(P) transhydrogenase
MAVVGGGVIGSEYASIFMALGVEVTLVDSGDRLLSFVDREIAERLQARLSSLGLHFMFKDRVAMVTVSGDRVRLGLRSGAELGCDIALFAAGRQSNVEGLGWRRWASSRPRGLIPSTSAFRPACRPSRGGDVIGFPALASTSMEQARVAMVHAFNLLYKERISPVLPLAVYTIPEIAMVGLSEEACRERNIPYLVGRAFYDKSPRGQIIGDLTGMVKLVFSPEDGRLLGAHHIGELAAELVHIGAQVMAVGGTIDAFIDAVYNYPPSPTRTSTLPTTGLGQRQAWRRERGLEA